MGNAHSYLAALLGEEDGQEDFSYQARDSYPTIYFRSGNTQAADMAPGSLHHTGYWFIKEDSVPANDDGGMIEMTGWEPFTYTNTKNEKVHGFASVEIAWQVVAQRRCHRADNGARYPWDTGWDNDVYLQGYTSRAIEIMVNLRGIDSPTPFVISASNRQQVAITGHKSVEGVFPTFKRIVAPAVAEYAEMPSGSLFPLRCYWITVGVDQDADGPIFRSVKYTDENGEEQQSPAKTTFAVVTDVNVEEALASAEEVQRAAEQRKEYEEWRLEWNEQYGNPAAKKEDAPKAEEPKVEAPKGM